MRRLELWRSTPFRMAVSFAVLFVLTFVISGFVMYQMMRADLSHSLDETAKETFSVVAATYDGSDLEDLIATVKSHTKLTSPHERLFSLSGPDGSHLAGNFTGMDVPEGYSVIGDIPGVQADGTYRAYSGAVGANRLTVALSYSQTERLEEIVLTGFIWATLIVAALAVAGGAAIASRIQRRLDAIATTMGDVSQGRLGARIPLLGNGDDIDGVSTQVNEALDRLSALVEGMRQVSSDIAHDLKTPLNRLQIILEAAEYGSSNGEDITGQLVEARAESRQINDTFEALLRIAQIEAGARKARFAEVDLDAIVNSIAEIYTDVAEDSGMSLLARRTLQGPGGLVHGDAELLTQMFANLVENALRHCPAGTKIELSVRREGDRVTASVADDGPGIPPEEHENVFRRLYRIEKSRSTPGSGLGLSLVRAIADLHGATIRLEDRRPGLGVEATFSASRGGHS